MLVKERANTSWPPCVSSRVSAVVVPVCGCSMRRSMLSAALSSPLHPSLPLPLQVHLRDGRSAARLVLAAGGQGGARQLRARRERRGAAASRPARLWLARVGSHLTAAGRGRGPSGDAGCGGDRRDAAIAQLLPRIHTVSTAAASHRALGSVCGACSARVAGRSGGQRPAWRAGPRERWTRGPSRAWPPPGPRAGGAAAPGATAGQRRGRAAHAAERLARRAAMHGVRGRGGVSCCCCCVALRRLVLTAGGGAAAFGGGRGQAGVCSGRGAADHPLGGRPQAAACPALCATPRAADSPTAAFPCRRPAPERLVTRSSAQSVEA